MAVVLTTCEKMVLFLGAIMLPLSMMSFGPFYLFSVNYKLVKMRWSWIFFKVLFFKSILKIRTSGDGTPKSLRITLK